MNAPMDYTTLIDVDTLRRHLDDPRFVIFDCRHDLAKPDWGSEVYATSHLPHARFAHLDKNLSAAKTGRNGRHPLPDPEGFARWLGDLGVGPDSQVVGYDSTGGTYGSRLWWMLRWIGHPRVAVLDGGWDAWQKAGFPVTSDPPRVTPATVTARVDAQAAVSVTHVEANIKSGECLVIDARANDRFHGQNETIDPVAGHIPGARNRFFKNNLDNTGRFKSAEALRVEWLDVLGGKSPRAVINQCGSGVTACHNALAMEIAGLTGSRLFAGSWSEWITDPARPIATD